MDKNQEKFAQGMNPKPTPEQIAEQKKQIAKVKEDTTAAINEDIEFMRLKGEYETLQIEGYRNAVLLGNMEAKNVPGMLGLQLLLEDIELQGRLYRMKQSMEQGIEEEKKKKEMEKKNSGDYKTTNESPIIKP